MTSPRRKQQNVSPETKTKNSLSRGKNAITSNWVRETEAARERRAKSASKSRTKATSQRRRESRRRCNQKQWHSQKSLTDQRQRHCSAEAQRLNHTAGTPSQALPRTEETKLRNCETRKILETTASRRLIENQDRNSLPKKLDGQRVTPQQEKEKI